MDEQNNEKSLASSFIAESSPPNIPKKTTKPVGHLGPYDPRQTT